MKDSLDIVYELPFRSALWLVGAADDFLNEILKVRHNPRTCKTYRLEYSGIVYLSWEDKVVPRKKQQTNISSNGKAANGASGDDLRFINVSIAEDALPEIEQRLEDIPRLCFEFLQLTARGAAVLVKRKRGSDDWLAMVTFDDPYRDGALCAITAWGSDPADAVAAFCYKWFDILGEQIPTPDDERTSSHRRFG